ncbi:hypothetical protein OG21DRAFT_1501891 [Imleria badia]|nr:hypothetical protein OG21DRAFT_1501891 [Imleria badia]
MLLSQEDEHSHPYWYARVCAIFHMLVEYRPDVQSAFSKPEWMDVLFVRWFRRDINFDSGWDAKRLPRIQFFDAEHPAEAFGFVHPDSVIRGIHLIPTFTAGPTHELLSYDSFVRQDLLAEGWESQLDWRFFYVNIFVDRDIFMRFRGGGVGHKITRDWDKLLQREGRHNPPSEDSSDEGSSSDSEDDMEGNEELGEDEAEEAEAQGGTGRIDDGVDVVVADDGEELDEVIWDAEGYDAL